LAHSKASAGHAALIPTLQYAAGTPGPKSQMIEPSATAHAMGVPSRGEDKPPRRRALPLRRRLPRGPLTVTPAPPEIAFPEWMGEVRIRRALRDSHRVRLLGRRTQGPPPGGGN